MRAVVCQNAELRVEDLDSAYDERGAVVLTPVARLHRLVREGVVLEKL